ncbi:hypothetical protein FOH10_09350 [Nocardia otitidiscaviarum]|uniref:Uncharacterized protein n=1 Tax=Nocardia otitidiscaviarum TaxID=1823 RepID=A0A516NJ38_9NOCA|nr:DUF6585 family protein [Nocardia otitidiscaviarum]MCP9619640.1 hypothetical protein [Nocardia otitidiscaviarum]QDP78913.1 hypothetical protein FOH10_09350 [Nocardia otitidiscaviarum]
MVVDLQGYDEHALRDRVRQAAYDADLGAHREVHARMVARIQGWMLILGIVVALLATTVVVMISELLTRTDQMGGKAGNVVGLVVLVPLTLLLGVAFVKSMHQSLFGPATYRAVRLDLYDRGLVFAHNDEVRAVRYDTTVVHQEHVRHMLYGLLETKTTHDYTLLDVEGEQLRLQDYSQGGLPNAARWGAVIQESVTAAQLPAAVEELYRGEIVVFGALRLTTYEVGVGAKSVRWSQVHQIEVRHGNLCVYGGERRLMPISIPVRKVPNIHVFLTLAHRLLAENRRPGTRRPAPRPASRPAPTVPVATPDEFQVLLTMVMKDHAAAERLIAYERGKLPGADRATCVAKAVERLRRDRERQG